MSGFVAIPREVTDLWFTHDGLQGAVYVYLVMKANWQDAKGPLPNQKEILKTGQLVTSIRILAAHFGVSEKRIRTILDHLSTPKPGILTEFIRQEKGTHGTRITIVNYKELFQDLKTDGHAMGTPGAHGERHHNKGTREQGNKEDYSYVESAKADPTPYVQFLNTWNTNRGKLASVQKLTTTRKKKIKCRWTEEPDMDYWARLIQRMATSTFCCSGGWADLDWLIANDTNHLKVGQGKYDNRDQAAVQDTSHHDEFLRSIGELK